MHLCIWLEVKHIRESSAKKDHPILPNNADSGVSIGVYLSEETYLLSITSSTLSIASVKSTMWRDDSSTRREQLPPRIMIASMIRIDLIDFITLLE
jgi:hypothetical protein